MGYEPFLQSCSAELKVFFFLFFLLFFIWFLSLFSWDGRLLDTSRTVLADKKRLSVILPRERPSRFKGRALKNRAYERVPVQFRDNIQTLSASTMSFGLFSRCLMVQMFNGP